MTEQEFKELKEKVDDMREMIQELKDDTELQLTTFFDVNQHHMNSSKRWAFFLLAVLIILSLINIVMSRDILIESGRLFTHLSNVYEHIIKVLLPN